MGSQFTSTRLSPSFHKGVCRRAPFPFPCATWYFTYCTTSSSSLLTAIPALQLILWARCQGACRCMRKTYLAWNRLFGSLYRSGEVCFLIVTSSHRLHGVGGHRITHCPRLLQKYFKANANIILYFCNREGFKK